MGVPAGPAERRDLQPGADQVGEPPRGNLPHRQIPRGGAHVGHQEKPPHHELRETQPRPQVTRTDHKLIVTPYPHLTPTDRNWMTPLGIMGSYLVLHLCNILKRIVGSVRLQGTCTQGWAIP